MGQLLFRRKSKCQTAVVFLLYLPETIPINRHSLPISFSSASFPVFVWGSMVRICRLLYCASSPGSPLSDKLSQKLSLHLRFGLPLLLIPATAIIITVLPTSSFSVLKHTPTPLQTTFLYFLGNFCHLRYPSICYSWFCLDSTHPSQHPHFHSIQLLPLCFIGTVHHCWT